MIAAVLLSAALCGGVAQATPAAAPAPPRILVVPFETPGRDGRTYWLGEAAALIMTDDLNARGLGAITRTGREWAYEQLHLPPHTVLSRATVIKIGEIVGASQVIVGGVTVDGEQLIVRAQSIRIDVGRAGGEVVERGALADLFAVVRAVARGVVPGAGDVSAVPMPSPRTFEQYVKGLLAEQPATQASFLETALTLDPAYDPARLALWEVRTGQGDHAAALTAARAVSAASPSAHRAQFLAGVSLVFLKRLDEAFTAFKDLQQVAPGAAVLNNIGVVQLRRGGPPADGRATYFLTKAAESAPDDPDVLFNLGYAYALDRDPQAAIYWLREALRRDPADGDAHFVIAAALDASGNAVEAGRERELAGQLSQHYADAAGRRDPLPRGLGRVAQDPETAARRGSVVQNLANTAQRNQQDLARFHLERARRLFDEEQDRDAMAELQRTVFLSPYEAEAHLLVGRIHLRGGRPREAVDALKISIWSRDSAEARVVLASAYLRLDDVAAARTQAQKALELDAGSLEAKALLARIGGNQRTRP